MISPSEYDRLCDQLITLYDDLDNAIIADITRRILKTGDMTETAKWQAKQLQESGMLYDDILAEIARRTDATQNHVKSLFEDAGVQSIKNDNRFYRAAGLSGIIALSPAAMQVLNAGFAKCSGNLKNLTLTTAVTSQQAYINACNQAYMQVTSGAFSYQEAIKMAIKKTAESDAMMLYPSGHQERTDVAVRRAVLTGVGQTVREVSRINAMDMDCDLMEITAHSGARPEHAKWQGKLVSLSGKNAGKIINGCRVLSLSEIGYGSGDGFGGWNCRHDWFPFFVGISKRAYSDERLKELDARNIEYNGKKYTEYEISQIHRRYEREIRAAKREQIAFKTAVQETQDPELKAAMQDSLNYANDVVKRKQAKMRDFIQQTGRHRDYFREQNYADKNILTSDRNGGIISSLNNYHAGIFSELKNKIKNTFTNKKHLLVSEEYLNELPKKSTVYSIYEDMKATNPNYSKSYEYKINCQRCVPAYEMRRRGYNVIATPSFDDDTLGFEFDKIFVNMKWKSCSNGSGIDDIRKYMEQWGNGARAEISLQTVDGSHLFVAEQHDGITHFIDPQNYKANAEKYFEKRLFSPTRVCRIDNLQFSELIRECCEKVIE